MHKTRCAIIYLLHCTRKPLKHRNSRRDRPGVCFRCDVITDCGLVRHLYYRVLHLFGKSHQWQHWLGWPRKYWCICWIFWPKLCLSRVLLVFQKYIRKGLGYHDANSTSKRRKDSSRITWKHIAKLTAVQKLSSKNGRRVTFDPPLGAPRVKQLYYHFRWYLVFRGPKF